MSAKMTVRELVQSTLSSMDSDAVDSIGDTIESEQIAMVCREVYYEMATYMDIPAFQKLIQLDGIQNVDQRAMMKIPAGCTDISNLRYMRIQNGRKIMEPVEFLEKDLFYDRQWELDTSKDTVGMNILPDNIQVPYRSDTYPRCWTTFDDCYITFDAIDRSVDDTLHNDASSALGYVIPPFAIEDDHIPALPEKYFPQYLQQIKELSFLENKQMANPLEREKRQRSEHRNRHLGSINDGLDNGPRPQNFGRQTSNFGRRSRRS